MFCLFYNFKVKIELAETANDNEVLNLHKENIQQNELHDVREVNLKLKNSSLTSSPQCSKVKSEEHLKSPDEVFKQPIEKEGAQKKLVEKLPCEWSTKKIIKTASASSKGAILKPMPIPPQAYLAKDIYKKKHEEAERRRAEEERKKREFHSRPVPKFDAYHEKLEKRKPVHSVTTATTPQVLKKSREAEEKRKKKVNNEKYVN